MVKSDMLFESVDAVTSLVRMLEALLAITDCMLYV